MCYYAVAVQWEGEEAGKWRRHVIHGLHPAEISIIAFSGPIQCQGLHMPARNSAFSACNSITHRSTANVILNLIQFTLIVIMQVHKNKILFKKHFKRENSAINNMYTCRVWKIYNVTLPRIPVIRAKIQT